MTSIDYRQQFIIDQIELKGSVNVIELAEIIGVSDMTIRGDLRELENSGLIRRFHCGAVNKLVRGFEPLPKNGSSTNIKAKKVIGSKTAELVFDGNSIAIDVGTTTLELISNLRNHLNLKIVTSSLPIANKIISTISLSNIVRLIFVGVIVRDREFSIIGYVAEHTFNELMVDKTFITIGLFIDLGIYEYNIEDTIIKKALIRSSKQKIIKANNSKIFHTAFSYICPISDIRTFVTEEQAPEKSYRVVA